MPTRLLFPGEHGCEHEEEIVIDGHRATWYTGEAHSAQSPVFHSSPSSTSLPPPSRRVLQSFTHSSPILSALFARFPSLSSSLPAAAESSVDAASSSSTSSSRYLVLVHPDCLSIYARSGDIFSVPLPFRVAAAFPLLEGLLMQRTAHGGSGSTTGSGYPVLFTLMHPLEEVKPVSRMVRAGANEAGALMVDEDERVLWASDTYPLLVTWHTTARVHRAYVIRQSSRKRSRRWDRHGQGTEGAASDASSPSRPEDARLIHSELLLDGCTGLESATTSPCASSAFLSSTAEGEPLLCLCVGDGQSVAELRAYRLRLSSPSDGLSHALIHAFTLPALSACPITPLFARSSTPITPCDSSQSHISDLVVLSPKDHSLTVHRGPTALVALSSVLGSRLPSPALSLSHAVGTRFSLHTVDETYRVHLPPAVRSPLVHACFEALSYVLPVTALVAVRRDWLATLQRQKEEDVTEESAAIEWRRFVPLLLELAAPSPVLPTFIASSSSPPIAAEPSLPPSQSSSLSSPSLSRKSSRHTRQISMSPVPTDGNDAWDALLASDHHRQYARYPLFSRLASSNDVIASPPASSSRDSKRRKKAASSSSLSLSSREAVQPHAAAVLLCLHLTYESFKLDTLAHVHLQPLAVLCHGLARRLGASDWCEAYQRDCPELTPREARLQSSPPSAISAAVASTPPSILRWVHHQLEGSAASLDEFPLPASSLIDSKSPFELLRRVCECYELMSQPLLARSRYSSTPHDAQPVPPGRRTVVVSPMSARSEVPPQPSLSASRGSPATFLSQAPVSSDRSVTMDSHPLFTPSPARSARRGAQAISDSPVSISPSTSAALTAVLSLLTAASLARLPFGVAAPLYQLLYDSRNEPSSALSSVALALIGRPDLARMKRTALSTVPLSLEGRSSLLDLMDTAAGRPQPLPGLTVPAPPDGASDVDGTLLTLSAASFRFGSDLRLKQIRHLLRSTRLVSLSLTRERLNEIEASSGAIDVQLEYQNRLFLLSRRILALPIARGMLTLSSFTPPLTTAFPVPPLTLSARVHPKLSQMELDMAQVPFDLLDWPAFHNGAAAALRIRATATISSAFILYNAPAVLSYSHAGWLYGLGLMGGLGCLSTADLYRYLSQHHDGVTVALLLGMSCVKRRTMDAMTSKMLCLHVPAFLPAHLEAEIGLLVKTAAVVGLGLVYEGSAHRLMTEVLLGEIDHRGHKEKNKDREQERGGYALAAGFGLGLVMLRRGGSAPGVSDLKLEDHLITLLHGGLRARDERDSALRSADADRPAEEAKAGKGDLIDLDVTAPAATVALCLMYLQSNNANVAAHLVLPQSHYEMDFVNADFLLLRSLARGMILWDAVRPTRAWVEGEVPAVMRANVKPVDDYHKWEDGPGRDDGEAGLREEEKSFTGMDDSMGESSARWASDDEDEVGSDNDAGDVISQHDLDSIALNSDDEPTVQRRRPRPRKGRMGKARVVVGSDDSESGEDDIDYEACRQGYCNIIAGRCLALGIVFAGTADASAEHVLSYYVRCFRAIRAKHSDAATAFTSAGPSPLHHLDRHTLETCLLACMLALAVVMAGTGDLATMRLFLSLQHRVDERHTVGRQQAFYMAFGLLFLGGGEWSLKAGRDGAVGLLLSMYPFFGGGASTNENRLYLQALRHLYVLSAECRAMKAFDVDSGNECYCGLQVRLRNSERVLHLTTPCLLPHVADIASVHVVDDGYWPIVSTFSSAPHSSSASAPSSSSFTFPSSTRSPYLLHVKRRSLHALRDLDVPSFLETVGRAAAEREQRDGDPSSVAAASAPVDSGALLPGETHRMVRAICDADDVLTAYRWLVEGEAEEQQLSTASTLLHCLRGDHMHVLPIHLHLRRLLPASAGDLDAATLTNVRLLSALDRRMGVDQQKISESGRLFPASLLALCVERIRALVASAESSSHFLRRYLEAASASSVPPALSSSAMSVGGEEQRSVEQEISAAARHRAFLDLPSATELRSGLATLKQLMAGGQAMGRGADAVLLPLASMLFPSLSLELLQQVVEECV